MEFEEQQEQASALTVEWKGMLPYLALACGIIGLGFSAIFVRWANAPGPVTGFYRMAIAAAVMAIPFGMQLRKQPPAPRFYFAMAALGGIFFAGDIALWNTSVLVSSATTTTFLGNTSPLWVALGALILFKQKLGRVFWIGLLVTMIGAVAMVGSDFLLHPMLGFGDLLAMLAGVCYGAFFLAAQRARDRLTTMVSWYVSVASSALFLLVLSLVFRQPLWGYPASSYLNFLALALVTQVGGWLLINYALGHLPASIVSPSVVGQPVMTAILAVPLLDESLGLAQIIGCALVLIGILVVNMSRERS